MNIKDRNFQYLYEKSFDNLTKILTIPKWWIVQDSNLRPQRCQRCALPTELTTLKD